MTWIDRIRRRLDAAEQLADRHGESSALIRQLVSDQRKLLAAGTFPDEPPIFEADTEDLPEVK